MATALLEREFEIGVLAGAVTQLNAGCGGVIAIEAAPGTGKTALLHHLRDIARTTGLTVLSARGAEMERDFTFGVVRQLIEPLLPRTTAARDDLFSGAAASARHLFDGWTPGATDSLHPLLNGLYWLLVDLLRQAGTPTLIMVDDTQWADVPSLRFLGFLARRLDSLAVTLVVASRMADRDDGLLDDLLSAANPALLQPGTLSPAAVAELVRRAFGRQPDAEFSTACHTITGGNPLYVRELVRILVAGGTRPDAAAIAAVESAGPDAVRRHLAARMRRQPEALQRVATAVAVLGDDADIALVARLSDQSTADTATAAAGLVRHGVFERADPPAFVHAIIRDVVLSLTPPGQRSEEHRRAAMVLTDAGLTATRVASQFLRTTPGTAPDCVDVLLRAARHARRQGSPGNAAVFLRRARSEPPPLPLRSEINRLLGNCEAHQLSLPDAETHLREALSLADSPVQRSLSAYSLARFRHACGDSGEAVRLLTQAAGGPQAHDRISAEFEAELIGIARNDIASRALVRDRLAAFRHRPGTPPGVVAAQLSTEALLAGEPVDQAVELARQALLGDQLAPDRSAIWTAVHTLIVADHLDEAELRLHRALHTSERAGLMFPTALTRGFLSRVAWLRGDLAMAAEHATEGLRGLRAPNFALPVLEATRVALLIEEDKLDEADDVLRHSVLSKQREPRTGLELWLLEVRVRLRLAQDRADVALADIATGQRLYRQWGADRMPDVPWRLYAADALRRLGDSDGAACESAGQLELARSFGVARHIGVALRVRAAVTGTDAAACVLLREAADLLGQSSARLELATTLEQLGASLTRIGDLRQARQTIGQAAELATQCHAPGTIARLRSMLGDTADRPPAGATALTRAERQVAGFVGTGMTNRQIAERLFLSEKTIETHLTRSYRKLGVRSRTQLALRISESA